MSVKELLAYLKVYRDHIGRRLYIVFVLTIAGAFTEGVGLVLLLPLLRTTGQTSSEATGGTVEQLVQDLLVWMGIHDSMIWILVFIGAVFILKGLLKFIETGYLGILQASLLRNLKSRLFHLYSHVDYRLTLEKNTGHFINVITQQVNHFFISFDQFIKFLTYCVMTLSYFIIAFALTWKFATMALVMGAIMMVLFRILNRYVRSLSLKVSSEQSELNKLLVQSLQALKYLLSTGEAPKLKKGVDDSIHRLTSHIKLQRIAHAFTASLKEPVTILFIVIIIAVQVGVLNQPLAPIFVAIVLFNRGVQSIMKIQSSLQLTMERIGAVEMVDHEFEILKQHQERSGFKKLDTFNEKIEFNYVSLSYQEGEKRVLNDINLEINARSTVAFVGESGAGKSTLINTITLLLKPDRGSILIDGIDSREVDLLSWRSQIGYVSQETVVFDDTVANNICLWAGEYGNDEKIKERIHNSAQKAYAHKFIQDLPNGYQTKVGERGVRLSGGQRQRLFIARELFKNPNLLILDEATSALDTESERYIQQSIDALKGEITVVIIAHRLSTIKSVDQVFVLENGSIVESGSYRLLSTREKSKFKEMIEMQSL